MRPDVGEVLHFSEDPSITAFVPHVAATAKEPTAFVWAVGHAHAPSYWFPRQCPRAMAWLAPSTTEADRDRILGPTTSRVHLVEYAWLQPIQAARVFAYRFDAAEFEPSRRPQVIAEESGSPASSKTHRRSHRPAGSSVISVTAFATARIRRRPCNSRSARNSSSAAPPGPTVRCGTVPSNWPPYGGYSGKAATRVFVMRTNGSAGSGANQRVA